ncbi:hypothetical protein DHEL01_v203319 [Diaporthe helianthi]|uniref:Mediator complex subunit 15 KIX domain-containing protein n=1 Tax=Diaporthe helianthi TaxID=158607 RepID=A0A2P5I6Z6_DIAHE|nr:hypothetical protein DHEL01_v203319 [Diaporthe helianthi]
MAAPMQQMPGGLMPQQQNRFGGGMSGPSMDFSQFAFNFINSSPYAGPGWQTTVAISERVGKAHELITSAVLATPGQPWQRLAHLCVQFEQNAFRESPDKVTYDHRMRQKSAEMHARRQGQVPQLQESMNAQAAQQRQQQMMMMNQRQQQQQQAALLQAQMAGRAGGPNQPGGFHQLQNPMQLSQLPQQAPQMGLSLSNGMNPQMNPGQAGFPMPQGPQRGPDQQPLTDADKQRIQALAQSLMQQASDAQKQQMMQNLAQRLEPQRLAQMRAQGQNPLAMLFQQEATKRFMLARRNQMQQKQGMPPNTPGMQMQPGQQRPNNPNMMNNMSQQGGQMGPYGNNMESIMNEQKQGLLAEQAGQLVVPASSGPGRNATPQPLTGMQSQNMFSQGQNQTQQPQMPNGFNLQQQQQMKQQMAASHAQAQMRAAQAKSLQGQPGGISGPMPASQSPAMDNLNAPVRQPPVAMAQMGSNQGQPGNPQFGQGLDPRFNQPGGPGQMPGNPNMPQDPAIRQMLSQLDPEQRQKFRQLPAEKLNELFSKWKRTGMLRPGQMQQGGPMNQANPTNLANPMGSAMHQQPQGGMGPQMQQANLQNPMNRFRGGNPLQHPQAQMIMDNMDLPPQVMQLIPGIPPEAKKWGQFKAWVSQTNAGIPDQQKQMLRNIQLGQFKRMVMSHGQGGVPQQPGAPPNANPLGNLPPNTPIPDVTHQEIQQFRMTQQNFRDAPDEQVKMFIQRLKIQRMRQAMGMVGQPPPGQPAPTVGAQPGALPIVSGPQQGMQPGQAVSAPAPAPEPSQTPVTAGPQANRPPQPNMAAPPNNLAASQPKNNLKRSGDDLEAPSQPNSNDQRPASQPVQLPAGNIPTFTPEQMAKMTPDARARYEAMRTQNQSPEMARFRTICQEEVKAFETQRFPEIPMTADMRNQLAGGIGKILQEINKYSKAINPWFRATRDEVRLRAFLRTRLRVMNQCHPSNNKEPPVLKENLTMTVQEINQAQGLCQSIHKDLASIQRGARPPQPGGPATNQPAAQPQQPQQAQQAQQAQQPQRTEQPGSSQAPTPLNEANLAKQTQALNKAHQRSNSKSGLPPAAPTSSQPPFPIGAASPDGKPLWVASTPLTQEKLQLPSARKKIKTANGQASSPAVSSQNASPQTKVTSPDLKKKEAKAAPKPAFMCTEPGCEMAESGFPTEEARKQHHQDVHVLPYEDPQQFMQQSFAAAFGLDEQGQPKPPPQPAPEEAAPMSREASAKQQGSATGGAQISVSRATDNKAAATGSKPGDKSVSEQMASGLQQSQAVDPLANTTIDPQSLMAPMMHMFDPAAGGVISDMTLYRSTTPPEDTPESSASKDSGLSEPNSDIPETANLEIDMNWQNFDDSTLVNGIAAFGMDMELNSFEGMASFPNDEMLITEDMLVDMDKPLTGLDPSLYQLNSF